MGFKKAPSIKHACKGKYPMRMQDIRNSAIKLEKPIYRIVISNGQLYQVTGTYEDYYVGDYINSYGGPIKKSKMRKLTDDEFEKYNKSSIVICGISIPLKITKD